MADLESRLTEAGQMTAVGVRINTEGVPRGGADGKMAEPSWGTGDDACLYSDKNPHVSASKGVGRD